MATATDTLALGRDLAEGSAGSFALNRVASAGGTLERIAAHAEPLLRKDVRLVTDVAAAAGAEPDIVLSAADGALDLMNHQRPAVS